MDTYACQTPDCELFGVAIAGVENIPADLHPIACGMCGQPISQGEIATLPS